MHVKIRKQSGVNWIFVAMTLLIAFILTFLVVSSL